MPLRVMVVDDEAPARKKILRFLNSIADVEVVAEAANGAEAVTAIGEKKPDLLFLDVQMPGMDGFEVLREIGTGRRPRIVFVTAHDEYAIRAFDVHAIGYLLKPFDRARFMKVLEDARTHLDEAGDDVSSRLRQLIAEMERRKEKTPRLLVQHNQRAFFLALEKIDWAESDRNYLKLHVGDQTYTIRGTVDSLEEKLDSSQFLRLNRSAIVRLDFIRELQSWFHGEYKVVLTSGETLMWTRRYVNRHPEILQKL